MQSQQWLSIPFDRFDLSIVTLARGVLFSCFSEQRVLRRTYGKDNRVLHTAKLPQGFKVVPPSRTRQGARISSYGTKIGVTAPETRTARLQSSQVEQPSGEQTMSAILNCVSQLWRARGRPEESIQVPGSSHTRYFLLHGTICLTDSNAIFHARRASISRQR